MKGYRFHGWHGHVQAARPRGGACRAVCAPGTLEMASGLASPLGIQQDTQKPSRPIGKREKAFGKRGGV